MNYIEQLEAQNETLQSLLSQSQEEAENLKKELKEVNEFKYFFETYYYSSDPPAPEPRIFYNASVEKTLKYIRKIVNFNISSNTVSDDSFTLYVDFIYFIDDTQYLPLRIFNLEVEENRIKQFILNTYEEFRGVDFRPIQDTIKKLIEESPYEEPK